MNTKTTFEGIESSERNWHLVDASGLPIGRLASEIAQILRGKHKTFYTPNMQCGDNIVVINCEKVLLKGNKKTGKEYFWHTGYPGGIKETTPEKLYEKKPGEALKLAVKRMLPSGVLGRKQLTKLKIYSGSEHPHTAQNPKVIDLSKLNSKNIARI